jgi:phosphoribosylformimino-5-aminoimidazole carboxamide ribotide isomerase
MRGLLTIHPFAAVYVADLDAIAGHGDHHAALAALRAQFVNVEHQVPSVPPALPV